MDGIFCRALLPAEEARGVFAPGRPVIGRDARPKPGKSGAKRRFLSIAPMYFRAEAEYNIRKNRIG